MQHDDAQNLAGKIAELFKAGIMTADLSSIRSNIDAINARLDRLENLPATPHSAFRAPQSIHPSTERFAVAEALADEIFTSPQKEKACTFEPNGKPCDHCSMCSSRGF